MPHCFLRKAGTQLFAQCLAQVLPKKDQQEEGRPAGERHEESDRKRRCEEGGKPDQQEGRFERRVKAADCEAALATARQRAEP